jgi:hypothetical protein
MFIIYRIWGKKYLLFKRGKIRIERSYLKEKMN